MKKKRRILAFLIAMVMMVTDVSGIWAASENVQDYTSGTDSSKGEQQSTSMNVATEGEGTVGSLVSEELQQEFTRTQAEAYISDLTVEGKIVTVSYVTNVQADLVTGIFTEDGKSLLASGHALVEPTEQTSVQIELSDTPPQYFRVSAYLLDAETREPVCEAYDSQYYTSDIQKLMDKTASDFEDTGRMVYLDTGVAANQEENFAVYKEGVVSVEENDTANILTINADGT